MRWVCALMCEVFLQIKLANSLGVTHEAHRGSDASGITLYAGSNNRRNALLL